MPRPYKPRAPRKTKQRGSANVSQTLRTTSPEFKEAIPSMNVPPYTIVPHSPSLPINRNVPINRSIPFSITSCTQRINSRSSMGPPPTIMHAGSIAATPALSYTATTELTPAIRTPLKADDNYCNAPSNEIEITHINDDENYQLNENINSSERLADIIELVQNRETAPTTVIDVPSIEENTQVHTPIISENLLRVFFKHMLPFQVIQDILNATNSVPMSENLTLVSWKNYVNRTYNEKLMELTDELSRAENIALTLEVWEDSRKITRVGVTCHYIKNDYLKHRFLFLTEIEDTSTKKIALRTVFDEIAHSCPLEKVQIAVASLSNIDITMRQILGPGKYFGCFAQSINEVASSAIKSIEEVWQIVQQIYKLTKTNADMAYMKETIKWVKQPNSEVLGLPNEDKNSWLWAFSMAQLVELKCPAVLTALNTLDVSGKNKITICEEICQIFGPFYSVVLDMNRDRWVEMSKVIPYISQIIAGVSGVQTNTDSGRRLKQALLHKIKQQLGGHEYNKNLACATILDPRFRGDYINSASAKQQAIDYIRDSISKPPKEENVEKIEFHLWNKCGMGKANTADSAINYYLNCTRNAIDSSPIQLWKTMKSECPELYPLGMSYATMPATVISPGRAFTENAHYFSGLRNAQDTDFLHQALFLNSYYEQ